MPWQKVARSLHEFPNPGLAQYSDLLLDEWWAPRSLPQAVTKAKVLGSCFSRTCHHTSSLFTWRQSEQESVLYDLYAVKVTAVPAQIWFGSPWWRAMKEVTFIMRHGATHRAVDGSCAWRTRSRPFNLAKPAPLGRTTRMGSVSQAKFRQP